MHKSIHLCIAKPLYTRVIAIKEVNLNCKKREIYLPIGLKMNFKTVCFLFTFLTSICSQSLYDTNYQQLSVLNRGNSEVVFKSLLDETENILKETMSKMQRCFDMEEIRSVANEGLLKMYSKGQFPNGKFPISLQNCYNVNTRTRNINVFD